MPVRAAIAGRIEMHAPFKVVARPLAHAQPSSSAVYRGAERSDTTCTDAGRVLGTAAIADAGLVLGTAAIARLVSDCVGDPDKSSTSRSVHMCTYPPSSYRMADRRPQGAAITAAFAMGYQPAPLIDAMERHTHATTISALIAENQDFHSQRAIVVRTVAIRKACTNNKGRAALAARTTCPGRSFPCQMSPFSSAVAPQTPVCGREIPSHCRDMNQPVWLQMIYERCPGTEPRAAILAYGQMRKLLTPLVIDVPDVCVREGRTKMRAYFLEASVAHGVLVSLTDDGAKKTYQCPEYSRRACYFRSLLREYFLIRLSTAGYCGIGRSTQREENLTAPKRSTRPYAEPRYCTVPGRQLGTVGSWKELVGGGGLVVVGEKSNDRTARIMI
ncbi:hypothetical protein DFH06DRAFT_1144920 [Mycena polygramma]|nr:hypothetical protein DFH06DRAFT_1144920 [Mycena polygramma]